MVKVRLKPETETRIIAACGSTQQEADWARFMLFNGHRTGVLSLRKKRIGVAYRYMSPQAVMTLRWYRLVNQRLLSAVGDVLGVGYGKSPKVWACGSHKVQLTGWGE